MPVVRGMDLRARRGGEFADQRIVEARPHQQGEVIGSRDVLARQTGRLGKAAAVHAELTRLFVHARDECVDPSGVAAPQRTGRPILGRHECHVQ